MKGRETHEINDLPGKYCLSHEQVEVILIEGNCVIEACPGSGKTRTVGTRLAHRMRNWGDTRKGIAVISFTNVAAGEIAERLSELGLSRKVPRPHFLGTIDSFVDQHIFMPHGHRVMRPKKLRVPELVLDYNLRWVNNTFTDYRLKRIGLEIIDFHFATDGSIYYRGNNPNTNPTPEQLRIAEACKLRMAKAGYATHTDAMYWSMKVLQEYPAIAMAIAIRYPEIIVDEFQDTSDIQLQIFRVLHATGKHNLILVGDPHQSIFGFNQARPGVLLSPTEFFAGKWNNIKLNSNYRSSQKICNVTFHFSGRENPDNAVGKYKDFDAPPFIFCYPDKEPLVTLEYFSNILNQFKIPLQEGVIITRKNTTVDKLLGRVSSRKYPKQIPTLTRGLLKAAYYRDMKIWPEAYKQIQYTLLEILFERTSFGPNRQALGALSDREWLKGSSFILHQLPPIDMPIKDWVSNAKSSFEGFQINFAWANKQIPKLFPNIKTGNDINLTALEFMEKISDESTFTIKTIHKVKGESHTAVMLVATPQMKANYPSDALNWVNIEKEAGLVPEEARCLYVSITRPQKVVVIAIPESAWKIVHEFFLVRGFEVFQ